MTGLVLVHRGSKAVLSVEGGRLLRGIATGSHGAGTITTSHICLCVTLSFMSWSSCFSVTRLPASGPDFSIPTENQGV